MLTCRSRKNNIGNSNDEYFHEEYLGMRNNKFAEIFDLTFLIILTPTLSGWRLGAIFLNDASCIANN